MSLPKEQPRLYGVMAEFDNRFDLMDAIKSARAEGYSRMDAYTPFPIHGLGDALGFQDRRLPILVLLGGLFGCFGGFGLLCMLRPFQAAAQDSFTGSYSASATTCTVISTTTSV